MISLIVPPGQGGVRDFTDKLSENFGIDQEISVCVWDQHSPNDDIESVLASDCVYLQYSGYGYAKRGAPLWLLKQLQANRPKIKTLGVFFHELYAFGSPRSSAFWLSPMQRHIARKLAEMSDFWVTNREGSARWLERFAGNKPHAVMPVFSNVGEMPAYSAVRVLKVVVFGGVALRMATYRAAGEALFAWAKHQGLEIHVQSPKNLIFMSEIMRPKKQLDIVYNWSADNHPLTLASQYRQQLNLENKVVFFYGGNIGSAQDMMNVVRLAKAMLAQQNAHFVLVGAGDEVELVRNAILENDLTNMTLLPPVTQAEYQKMLAEFDVGLFSLHASHTTHNFPGKLLGYMVESKPILGSINPDNDLKEVIETSGAGLISINGEDDILLQNALKLLQDQQYRITTGENAKRLLTEKFSVNKAARKILQSAPDNSANKAIA